MSDALAFLQSALDYVIYYLFRSPMAFWIWGAAAIIATVYMFTRHK